MKLNVELVMSCMPSLVAPPVASLKLWRFWVGPGKLLGGWAPYIEQPAGNKAMIDDG